MKKIYFSLFSLVLLCANLIQAQELITIKDVEFDATTGTITNYLANKTEIEIPATFTIGGVDYNVEKIGNSVFRNKNISLLVLPSTLKEIGQVAFADNHLSSINIPQNVVTIHGGAFNNNVITRINGVESQGFIFKRNSDGTEDNTTIVSYGGFIKEIDNTNLPTTVNNLDDFSFYRSGITKVILPNTITRIGIRAFQFNEIESLELPTSPERNLIIDNSAFSSNLIGHVSIPASIEKIGVAAFYQNPITTLTFPDELNTNIAIGDHAFEYNSLSTLILPEGITSLGKQSFKDNQLTSVTLPNTLTNVEGFAFYGNQFTAAIPLPASPVKEGYLFSHWENWDGVTVTHIDDFYNSYNAVFIKDGATTITLADIDFDKETGTITGYHGSATKIQIPNYFEIDGENIAVSRIGAEAFYGKNLTQVVLPTSIYFSKIEEMAFENNQLTEIDFPENLSYIGQCAFNNNQITKVNGQGSDGLIYRRNSYGEDKSTVVSYGGPSDIIDFIPENVIYLGSFAFSRNNITSVTIPANVININYSFNDNAINSVNGEASNGIIYAQNSDGSIDKTTVASYGGVADEITPDFFAPEVNTIASYAFAENGLTAIELPNTITNIYYKAFGANEITGTLTLPQGLEKIDENAFAENDISAVSLPNTVTEIAPYAFDANNAALTTIELKDAVKDGYTFIEWQNENAETVSLINDFSLAYKAVLKEAAHILTINDIEFDKTTGTILRYFAYFTNIEIPSTIDGVNVLKIEKEAFANKEITNIKFPNTLSSIGELAFNNNQLQEVDIPQSVVMISGGAFNRNSIKKVNNEDSDGIIYAKDGEGYFYKGIIVSYGGIKKNIDFIPDNVLSIGYQAFYNCNIETVEIPSNVEIIEGSAFRSNKIYSLTLNEGLKYINESAFSYNQITQINFPNSLLEIGEYAFENNNINNITLGNKIYSIGGKAFYYNNLNGQSIPLPVLTTNDAGEVFSTWVNSNGDEVTAMDNFYYAYRAVFTKATAIDEDTETQFRIYPNPVVDNLNIKWSEQITGVEIYSLSGNKVYQKYAGNNELSAPINVSQLNAGVYIIKVKSNDSEKVQRIVIR